MDYVSNFLKLYYADDIDTNIYELFINNYLFEEIANRMDCTTNIDDIEEAFHKINFNNDINEILSMIINYARIEGISYKIRHNIDGFPLSEILKDYAKEFCNKCNFPQKRDTEDLLQR